MKLIPIPVECYAGAKADETPRRFIWQGRTVEVGEVLDRWYQIEANRSGPGPTILKCEPWRIVSFC
jgi:Family of unknown function (DUF6504)